MPKKNSADATMATGRLMYMLDLARGSSHIASTRKSDTRERAIAEVLAGFEAVHGRQLLDVFRELLARRPRSAAMRRRPPRYGSSGGGKRTQQRKHRPVSVGPKNHP
jgi:hypothetical protein